MGTPSAEGRTEGLEVFERRYTNVTFRAWKMTMPETGQPNPSLDSWALHMPGVHPCWSHYLVAGVCLRDFPGCAPAKLHFPLATHEVVVAAIHPDCKPGVQIGVGELTLLEPVNYCQQITTASDEVANRVVQQVAVGFIMDEIFIEPEGIRGARERFVEFIRKAME
jgi:hypothetical protein